MPLYPIVYPYYLRGPYVPGKFQPVDTKIDKLWIIKTVDNKMNKHKKYLFLIADNQNIWSETANNDKRLYFFSMSVWFQIQFDSLENCNFFNLIFFISGLRPITFPACKTSWSFSSVFLQRRSYDGQNKFFDSIRLWPASW